MAYQKEFTRYLTSAVQLLGLLLWLFLKRVEGIVCIESLPTLREVERCPITAEDWGLASQKKRCYATASSQKCVSNSDEFVYQCLVNENQNGFVDVCAPKWILTGYCGFYDTNNGRIYNDVKKDCTKFDKSPCPGRFNSSDIFKYPGCYEIIKENKKDSSLAFAEQYLPWLKSNSIVSIISLILLIIVLLALAFYYRKSRNKNVGIQTSTPCTEEDPNDTVPKESDPFLNNNGVETEESSTTIIDVITEIVPKKRISKREEEEEEEINEEGESACYKTKSEDIPRRSEGACTFQRSYSIPVFRTPKKKRKRKKKR